MKPIFTIGHSTRSADQFLSLLTCHGIQCLADVRTVPHSRRNPQFEHANLSRFLNQHEIEYIPMKALGGLRKLKPDSLNTAWHNSGFRGFADYMQTQEFFDVLKSLIADALIAHRLNVN